MKGSSIKNVCKNFKYDRFKLDYIYGAANPIEVEEVLHPCELSTQCDNDRRLRRQKQQQRPRRRKYIKSPEKPRKSMKIAPN